MQTMSSCSLCNMFERSQMPAIGNILLVIGGVLAAFSVVVWPLMFVWPLLLLLGLGMAAGYGACTECNVP